MPPVAALLKGAARCSLVPQAGSG